MFKDKYCSDKLAHIQVITNCPYSIAQMCTREDSLAYILGTPSIDDVMSYNSLTTLSLGIQWGSEIRPSLDFEWSKTGWVANGLDFEWDLKSGSPTI